MAFVLFARITGPGARLLKARRMSQAGPTEVVFSSRVQKRPAACAAEGMGNQADLFSAGTAKVVLILPENPLPAGATARRIKPI